MRWTMLEARPSVLLYIFTGSRSADPARATHTPISPRRAIRRAPGLTPPVPAAAKESGGGSASSRRAAPARRRLGTVLYFPLSVFETRYPAATASASVVHS